MSDTAQAQGWTKLNIYLHWLVVVLIIAQYIDREWMHKLYEATVEGGESVSQTATIGGYAHIIGGTLILVASAIRLLDRFVHGKPPHPEAAPHWTAIVSSVTHFLLYAVLLAMPTFGLIAWLAGAEQFAHWHTFLWNPLLALIVLHIAGALVQQLHYKTGVINRMAP